jgi:hypothetical protein
MTDRSDPKDGCVTTPHSSHSERRSVACRDHVGSTLPLSAPVIPLQIDLQTACEAVKPGQPRKHELHWTNTIMMLMIFTTNYCVCTSVFF